MKKSVKVGMVVSVAAAAAIGWYLFGMSKGQQIIKNALTEATAGFSYQVTEDIHCGEAEVRQACWVTYSSPDDAATTTLHVIAAFKKAGYTVHQFPNGYDGPGEAYLARNTGKNSVIIYKAIGSGGDTAGEEPAGNVWLQAFLAHDEPKQAFESGSGL